MNSSPSSEWILARTARASSNLSWETSQRGVKGRITRLPINMRMAQGNCKLRGNLHWRLPSKKMPLYPIQLARKKPVAVPIPWKPTTIPRFLGLETSAM